MLILTDGAADGVDRYGVPADWATAVSIAVHDPAALVDLVHDTEQGDLDGSRWPPTKLHDDKTVAVIQLTTV